MSKFKTIYAVAAAIVITITMVLAGCPEEMTPAPATGGTTPPPEVTLIATPGNGSVTLSWTDPNEADFTHVLISWNPTGGDQTQPLNVPKDTQTTTITGLTNGTEYTFTAKSVYRGKESEPSAPVSATPTASAPLVVPCAAVVYGDASYDDCDPLGLATDAFGQNAEDAAEISFTEISGGMGNNSDTARRITLTGGTSAWAAAFFTLAADYDFTGQGLQIDLRSPADGGVGKIKVKLENEAGAGVATNQTNEVEKTFTNDGTWQTVTWVHSDFVFPASGLTAETVRRIVLVLSDANGATEGLGAQTIDVDEIRITGDAPSGGIIDPPGPPDPSDTCVAPVGSADATTDLVYGDAAYTSCEQVVIVRGADQPFGQTAENAAEISFEEISGNMGSNSSDKARRITLTGGTSTSAEAFFILNGQYDFTGKELKIDLKSPASASGGVGKIKAQIQSTGDIRTINVEKTFTNDGTWQTVTWAHSDFTFSDMSAETVEIIRLVLSDANGATDGLGAQTIDVDEVRIVADTTPPDSVANLMATNGEGQATLTWTDPTDLDFSHVLVSWTPTGGIPTQPITVGMDVETQTITGLTNGQEYTFTVKSVDESDNESMASTRTATPRDMTPPAVVTLTAVSTGAASVRLRWTEPTDLDFSHVLISWMPNPPTDPLRVNKGTETTTIESLTTGTEYTFTAKSVDTNDVMSADSAGATATPTADDGGPPATVTLDAKPGSDGRDVDITWGDPDDPDFSHVLIRWAPVEGDQAQPLRVNKGAEMTTITGLVSGKKYTFTAKSVDSGDLKSSISNEEEVTPNPRIAPPVTIPIAEDCYLIYGSGTTCRRSVSSLAADTVIATAARLGITSTASETKYARGSEGTNIGFAVGNDGTIAVADKPIDTANKFPHTITIDVEGGDFDSVVVTISNNPADATQGRAPLGTRGTDSDGTLTIEEVENPSDSCGGGTPCISATRTGGTYGGWYYPLTSGTSSIDLSDFENIHIRYSAGTGITSFEFKMESAGVSCGQYVLDGDDGRQSVTANSEFQEVIIPTADLEANGKTACTGSTGLDLSAITSPLGIWNWQTADPNPPALIIDEVFAR